MAGIIPKVLDDSALKCQLCMKSFTNPKLLPCLHSFCEACLVRYVKANVFSHDSTDGKRSSRVLDVRLIEEAIQGRDNELDQPIPVQGYDDVTETSQQKSNVPLFKPLHTSKSPSSASKSPKKEQSNNHEYSEIPPTENSTKSPSNAMKRLDIEKDSAYSSGSEILISPTTPSYLPMNRSLKSRSDPVADLFNLHEEFTTTSTSALEGKSQSARSSRALDNMKLNLETNYKKEKENGDMYIPMGSTNKLDNVTDKISPISPGVTYETMNQLQDMDDTYIPDSTSPHTANLTGFGSIGSPNVMPLFKKPDSSTNLAHKSESLVQLTKPASSTVKEKAKSSIGKLGSKLSKLKTSKSIDTIIDDSHTSSKSASKKFTSDNMYSYETSTYEQPRVRSERESTSVLHDSILKQLERENNKEDSLQDLSFRMSTCDADGYETPLNLRKPSSNSSDCSNLPALPPKTIQNDAPIIPVRKHKSNKQFKVTNKNNHSLVKTRSSSEVSSMSDGTSRSSACTSSLRDSVFDHIYEEIQCKENIEKDFHCTAFPHVQNFHANNEHMQYLLQKHHASKTQKSDNTRTKKVQELLRHSKPSSSSESENHEIPIVSLQVGNKLMRKSQTLLDDNGCTYISDKFEKVHLHHNDEDIDLIYTEVSGIDDSSKNNYGLSEKELTEKYHELQCPMCSSLFIIHKDEGVKSLPNSMFIEKLKETRYLENTLKPNCNNCGKNVKADFKCLECDHFLCKKCNDSHNWLKVVRNHQVIPIVQLQGSSYTTDLTPNKMEVCPNHSSETPQYYCDTCSVTICKECSHCYHNEHRCQPIHDVATRGIVFLDNFPSMTSHISQSFKKENEHLENFRIIYNHEKQNILRDISQQYAKAREQLEDAYQELMRHLDFRFTEEAIYIDDIQKHNEQFIQRVEHTKELANQVKEYGNPTDIIKITNSIATSLLDMQRSKPLKLEHKMNIAFNPMKEINSANILPLLGKATRDYQPVNRREAPQSSPNIVQVENRSQHHVINPINTFTPKTSTDTKGCKPTGIGLTRDDNLVLVDDINRKIKIFNNDGDLIREITPHTGNELIDPWDVTVTNYGNFAVTDRGSKQVKIFDPDGDLVCHFGPHLANPWGICCNADGDLLVTDTDHKCVYVHDSNGNLKYRIDPPLKLAKFPEYVTTNSYGDIIVSDLKAHCVYVFNLLGQFLYKIGPRDTSNTQLKLLHSPCGIYCDPDDNILVTDYEMMRVSKFDKNGVFIAHLLTYMDDLRAPQSLIVNRKEHVILLDGNFVKIFSTSCFEENDVVVKEDIDLELKPKVYNIRKSRRNVKSVDKPVSMSDTEEEEKELVRNSRERKTVHTSGQRTDMCRITRNAPNVKYSSSRSSSVPPQQKQPKQNPKRAHSPNTAFKSVINYDTPLVSVERIKQKLSNLDKSESSGSSSRSSTSPEKVIMKNYETSKVSIGKVKEKLLSKTSDASNGHDLNSAKTVKFKIDTVETNEPTIDLQKENDLPITENNEETLVLQNEEKKECDIKQENQHKNNSKKQPENGKPKLRPKPSYNNDKASPKNQKDKELATKSNTSLKHNNQIKENKTPNSSVQSGKNLVVAAKKKQASQNRSPKTGSKRYTKTAETYSKNSFETSQKVVKSE